jgi:hypothetical protein
MKQTITLGGKPVEVFDLPVRQNKQWKERALAGPLAAERQMLASQQGQTVTEGYNAYATFVSDHLDDMLDLVLDFLPDQSQRDECANTATQEEVLEAFVVVTNIAFSTSFFLRMYGGAWMTGSETPPTGTNSAEVNGDSGRTNSTPPPESS